MTWQRWPIGFRVLGALTFYGDTCAVSFLCFGPTLTVSTQTQLIITPIFGLYPLPMFFWKYNLPFFHLKLYKNKIFYNFFLCSTEISLCFCSLIFCFNLFSLVITMAILVVQIFFFIEYIILLIVLTDCYFNYLLVI